MQIFQYPNRYLHIRSWARKRYNLPSEIFSLRGCAFFPSYRTTRQICHKINQKKRPQDQHVKASFLYGAGLLHEAWHILLAKYSKETGKSSFASLEEFLIQELKPESFNSFLINFVTKFPPPLVSSGKVSPEEYLKGTTEGTSHKELILEEILLLHITNQNQSLNTLKEFFYDRKLENSKEYRRILFRMEEFWAKEPTFCQRSENLLDFLLIPIKLFPESLYEQLRYMAVEWKELFGEFLEEILKGLDFIQEEEKPRSGGPGPAKPWGLELFSHETESYSEDRDWMPKVVLLAKSTLVWLWQLSKDYNRPITRLDQIPEEEIEVLQNRGFNALWLIGLWERSKASKRIKQTCGNPEAEASAYSIFDYQIAGHLGGWEALGVLKDRCLRRGIRLAADMVPNHTGIDSLWLQQHPEWYIQTPFSPFPSYTFTGQDLSTDPQTGIFLEDHYYDKTDAAVVFKRVDKNSREERYIYHGNDGTHMPWNDTAQLNFLLPEVRSAVMNTILHVASFFPIIRFDAAMTLARKHFQRLWFPEPGKGGDIPSRGESALPLEEFILKMPKEFWREVVDILAEKAPDTLLLAEAFWLMESYFVRTLGMHRVYNSAFMHMLKQEKNQTYRESIQKTLVFDPDILKRFVNFMNNPDEDTAAAQFGSGDKYFGICTLLSTLPGLPMFGHGQIEGFSEKYGMEYSRAYWAENPNQDFIRRHEREIFPLLRRRYLFAEVEEFLFFDFFETPKEINQNVYSYLNGKSQERVLVFYNNNIERTSGWINRSCSYLMKREGTERKLISRTLAEGLGIHDKPGGFTFFRDLKSSKWFIRSNHELCKTGFYASLEGYEAQVYLDFYQVEDPLGYYTVMAEYLLGEGTENPQNLLKEIKYKTLHSLFNSVLKKDLYLYFAKDQEKEDSFLNTLISDYKEFLKEASSLAAGSEEIEGIVDETDRMILLLKSISRNKRGKTIISPAQESLKGFIKKGFTAYPLWPYVTEGFILLVNLYRLIHDIHPGTSETLIREWGLDLRIKEFLKDRGLPLPEIDQVMARVYLSISFCSFWDKMEPLQEPLEQRLEQLFQDYYARRFLKVNSYNNTLWFHKESFEELFWLITLFSILKEAGRGCADFKDFLLSVGQDLSLITKAKELSGFKVSGFIDFFK